MALNLESKGLFSHEEAVLCLFNNGEHCSRLTWSDTSLVVQFAFPEV